MFGALVTINVGDSKTGPKTTRDYVIDLIDQIQHRYSWSDCYLNALPIWRLAEITDALRRHKITATQDWQTKQSYLSWQLTMNITAAMGRKEEYLSFQKYLEAFGVVRARAQDVSLEERRRLNKAEAKRGLAAAARIVELDQKKKLESASN